MPAARDEALALVLSGAGARDAFDAEVARGLVANGRSVTHDRLEAAGWN